MKWKILIPIIFISLLVLGKYILWDFAISDGKRVGNLTKLSKKGKIIKTWEGTIDEGSGNKLTSYFSISDDQLGDELYAYEGREVILYYEEHIIGWPRDTKYDVKSWKPKAAEGMASQISTSNASSEQALGLLGQTLFCSLLGTLYKDQELYQRVKQFTKENNVYLFRQFEKCNE